MARPYNNSARSRNNEVFAELNRELGTIPPQAVDLEEAVLGALMIEKDAMMTVQEILKPESFYREAHQWIYQAMLDLSARIEPVDLYTVGQMLQRNGRLAEIGGAAYLSALTQKVGSAAHIEFHSTIIAQKAIQRELIRTASKIQKDAYDESKDVADLLDMAESEIFKIAESSAKRDVQRSGDVITKTMKMIEEASQKKGGFTGVESGFTALDRMTLGWQPSDLVIIAARPSMGKTAFVLTMARNIAVQFKKSVAFFSLEMSAQQLMMRLIVAESGLDSRDVRNGKIDTDQWKHLEKSIQPLQEAPLFIDDTPALSIFEFRSKARRLKLQYNVELIVIDYLQLMTGTADAKGNREQEVASISRALKAVAKELDIPIIALSQLNRSVESRGGNKRPQLSDLRESGAIEQDADLVAFIHRPEYYGLTEDEQGMPTAGVAEIIVAKHRNGAVDTVKLRFRKEQAKFMDLDEGGLDLNAMDPLGDGGFGAGSALGSSGKGFGGTTEIDSGAWDMPSGSFGSDEEVPF